MRVERRAVDVKGVQTRYLAAGEGPALVLLHALGESSLDWRWVIPALAGSRSVYAPDLPGFGWSTKPGADYSPAFFERFASGFLDALGIQRAAVVGNSLGGLVALRLALAEPARVAALGLVSSAGLGREISPTLRSATVPGYGESAVAWGKTPAGAAARAWSKAGLLFARPWRAPHEWLAEQRRLAQTPGFLEASLAALRAQADPRGQREILLEDLPRLEAPTLVLWGSSDRIFPKRHAEDAAARLQNGRLVIIPGCGHLPHLESPERSAGMLDRFLGEHEIA